MRMLVTHDEDGTIHSFTIPAQDVADDELVVEASSGEIVSQVDGPDVDVQKPKDLARILERFRVDRQSEKAKLVEK